MIVVEHDEDTMREADYLIDVGPGAGVFGERSLQQGTPKKQVAHNQQIHHWPGHLSGKRRFRFNRAPFRRMVAILKLQEPVRIAQDITARFPLGKFIAVAWSFRFWKSTLINGILKKAIAQKAQSPIRKNQGNTKTIPGD